MPRAGDESSTLDTVLEMYMADDEVCGSDGLLLYDVLSEDVGLILAVVRMSTTYNVDGSGVRLLVSAVLRDRVDVVCPSLVVVSLADAVVSVLAIVTAEVGAGVLKDSVVEASSRLVEEIIADDVGIAVLASADVVSSPGSVLCTGSGEKKTRFGTLSNILYK